MVTAYRLPDPKMQLFDNNGLPLAGGFVYTYAAGTSTPLATYADADQTGTNTNPIVLDASGRADVFWGTSLYKVVVTDSQATQLYSVDNFGTTSTGGGGSSSGPFGPATNVASATLVDLGTISGNFANITGTVTINSFGTTASTSNPIYLIKFNGSLTITASADILINSGVKTSGDSILTASGDHAFIEYIGSGVWKIFAYFRNDGSITATTVTCANLVETN